MDKEINIWLNNNPYKDKKKAKQHSDAILQQLLQNALNTSKTIVINKGINGKPYCEEPIYFSHSNSKQLYAYVVSNEHEVGLDVEVKKSTRDFMKTAERYFHPAEVQQLRKHEPAEQFDLFYRQWTRKEAWCKLEGGNLWTFLNKQPPKSTIHFKENSMVSGFAMALAAFQPLDNIRINSIGQI